MSAAAALAIKAAKGYRTWGARNARAFVRNHNVDPRLVRRARQLEAAQ